MSDIEAFILVGGKSSRMGTDKAHLTIQGKSFVEMIAERLAAVTDSIRVVGGQTDAGLKTVPDVYPNWGALGGVHAALAACSAEWALIVACDFPSVTSSLFQRLANEREGFDAVAPIQSDGIPQPLCTLYRVSASLVQAESLIKSGERKPIALLQSITTRWLPFSELAAMEDAATFFDNINTPEDYARLNEHGKLKKDDAANSKDP